MSEHTVYPADPVSSPTPDRQCRALAAALQRPRYEVLPLAGTADLVAQHVPDDIPVTVTASPRRGLEPTIALTEELARRGFHAVPHLAARLVVDESHLAETLTRMDAAGVRDVFVIGGDGDPPVGDFPDALALLTTLQRLRRCGVGDRVRQVGVAGYPEGHPFVGDERLNEALSAKQPLATYAVTQMCFDATAVSAWGARVRRRGVSLPVHVGIAGAVDVRKVLRIAGRIGVGQSARFLRRHRHAPASLLAPGGYRPDPMIRGLAADLAGPAPAVAGLHVYTLGDVAATEAWRRRALDRLTGDPRGRP